MKNLPDKLGDRDGLSWMEQRSLAAEQQWVDKKEMGVIKGIEMRLMISRFIELRTELFELLGKAKEMGRMPDIAYAEQQFGYDVNELLSNQMAEYRRLQDSLRKLNGVVEFWRMEMSDLEWAEREPRFFPVKDLLESAGPHYIGGGIDFFLRRGDFEVRDEREEKAYEVRMKEVFEDPVLRPRFRNLLLNMLGRHKLDDQMGEDPTSEANVIMARLLKYMTDFICDGYFPELIFDGLRARGHLKDRFAEFPNGDVVDLELELERLLALTEARNHMSDWYEQAIERKQEFEGKLHGPRGLHQISFAKSRITTNIKVERREEGELVRDIQYQVRLSLSGEIPYWEDSWHWV